MSLLPHRGFNRWYNDTSMFPYWLRSDDNLNVGESSTQVINDATKFGVSLDVSHFKPEELKVRLDGHVLTIEGKHELKDEHSMMERSFVRKWTLPGDCNLEAVRTNLDKNGHLAIEAPKKGAPASTSRNIPIEHK